MYSSSKRCFSYEELRRVPVKDNGEPLVALSLAVPEIKAVPGSEKMKPYVGDEIFVRQSVAQKLREAQRELAEQHPKALLCVRYGYRHPEIQKRNFDEFFQRTATNHPEKTHGELMEYVHHYMAIPEVGGHPVGGAVDVTIEDIEGPEWDMGTRMADFSDTEKVHVFSERITPTQKERRILLRTVMMKAGFAPYDFEWWHFSYGDREWACFYEKPFALYDSIDFRTASPLPV